MSNLANDAGRVYDHSARTRGLFSRLAAWIAFLGLLMPAIASSQPATTPSFLLGGDISILKQVEDRGGVYRDNNKAADGIAIFTNHGWNCFRLRLFVNPNGRGGVVNSLDYTRALAKRIKAAGATFILDIHYSDTWADPQHQVKPAAWEKLAFDDLEKQVETYTSDVIKAFKDDGTLPDIVQIGNEITGGTLWPDGQVQVPPSNVKVFEGEVRKIAVPEPYDENVQWDHLTRIIKAGVRGVRSQSDHPRIMIHIDCGGDWPITQWYFDHLQQHDVPYDIIGQSFYPNWHGTLDNVRDNLKQTGARYKKESVIVETAYPWRDEQYWSTRKNMSWPISPEGQRQFLTDLIKVVRDAPDGRGIGVIYWQPESLATKSADGRVGRISATSLFDADGNALPGLTDIGKAVR
jgi:arabinogalactan endo-1,4-beta-galactosidase